MPSSAERQGDGKDAGLRVGQDPSAGRPADREDAEVESFFADRRRLAETALFVLLLLAAIYVFLPKLVGLDDALAKLDEGDPVWLAIAFGFNLLIYIAYIALFRGVVGESVIHLEWRESYEITMASLAASRIFSAGGAGGIILTYWALRKAGLERRRAACRMVALIVLLYAVYLVALIVFGVLLRTGVLPGNAPIGLTIVPAALAGVVIAIFLLIALIPEDFERRFAGWSAGYRFGRFARRLATVPDTLARGTRTAIAFVREPSRGSLALIGTLGFWAANIGTLWACFKAFGVEVPIGVVVQGYFVGMVANLIPGAPGGVGTVDAGMIGAFVLFGIPSDSVFPAVLIYRLFAFWLPVLPGAVAFLQLRGTVARWDRERGQGIPVGARASHARGPILQKVK
jgi:putative heme transporter